MQSLDLPPARAPSRRPARLLAWLALAALTGACGGEASAPLLETTRVLDSAGVTVVENGLPAWTEVTAWRISPEPAVTVGVLEGPDEYQMYQVGSVLRLPGGRVAVTDGGSQQVRIYDGQGRHLSSTGSQGEGPGEFSGLGGLWRHAGDSLLAYDFRLMRVSVLDDQGRFGRSYRLLGSESGVFPFPLGRLSSGGLVVQLYRFDPDREPSSGLNRDPMEVAVFPEGESKARTLGHWPGGEYVLERGDNFMWSTMMPFARNTLVAVGVDRVWVGSNDAWSIQVLDGLGEVRRLIRHGAPLERATAEDRERYVEDHLARLRDDEARERERAMLERVDWHETFPAFGQLMLDRDGYLWAGGPDRPGARVRPWYVFDDQGRYQGQLDMPHAVRPSDIGPDYVAGVYKDELEVEFVVVYDLVRPAAGT